MADGKGIRRLVQIILDKASAARVKRDLKKTLDEGTDPKAAKRNIGAVGGALKGLAKKAAAVGAAIAAALAVRTIIRFGKEAVRVALESGEIWNRLAKAVESTGMSFRNVEGDIRQAARAMQDATTVGDEDFATILTELITTSGRYQESLQNVGVVADLAAAKQIDLRSAAQLVGRAMVGQTQTLTRYGIIVQEGADAVEVMRDRFAGFAANEANTFAGKLRQISNEWQDFKQAVGEALTEADNGVSTMETLRAAIEQLTVWVERNRIQLDRLATVALNAAAGLGKVLGVVLDFLDPAGKLAREQREIIDNLETEQQLQEKRAGLMQRLLELGREENEVLHTNVALRTVLGEHYKGRLKDIRSEQQAIAGLIRYLDNLQAARDRANAPATGGGGRPGIPAPSPRTPTFRPVPIEFGPPTMVDPKEVRRTWADTYEILREEQAAMTEAFRDQNFLIESAAQQTAYAVQSAWSQAFGLIIRGAGDAGDVLNALAAGTAQALLGGLGQYASGKAAENVALAFEEHAKALAAAANPFTAWQAPAHFAAAKAATLAALKWSLFGGIAGGAQAGINTGGGGTTLSGGARDSLSRNARGESAPTVVNIYIDPLDPDNPAYQDNLQRGVQKARERWGEQVPVRVHRRTR